MRIVLALSGRRSRTTSDLCAHLADVPRTTVYRQVVSMIQFPVADLPPS